MQKVVILKRLVSPSLRGSGLKYNLLTFDYLKNAAASPSLRGSGLKLNMLLSLAMVRMVSLFTGERIEIYEKERICRNFWSPSLRGSGLKFQREKNVHGESIKSPSLRGSGLKSTRPVGVVRCAAVSLFTGERIEISVRRGMCSHSAVSLFTGERIEIAAGSLSPKSKYSLPLYGGAD